MENNLLLETSVPYNLLFFEYTANQTLIYNDIGNNFESGKIYAGSANIEKYIYADYQLCNQKILNGA